MGSPSWEAESPAATIFAPSDAAKWVSSLGASYLPVKVALRENMIGVVWLGNWNTTTSQAVHVGCEGESLKGESLVLYVREQMFALEIVLILLSRHWMGANFLVKSSSCLSFLICLSSSTSWLHSQHLRPGAGSLVRSEESTTGGGGWCQCPPAMDHQGRLRTRVRTERHLGCQMWGPACYGWSRPHLQGPHPALLQEHPVVGRAGCVTHGREGDLWAVSEKVLERT